MKKPFETPVQLETNLDSREVYARLRSAVPFKVSYFASRSEYPVKSVVGKGECRLNARTRYPSTNLRQLRLSFREGPTGTRLIGKFAIETPSLVFMIFWFGFLAVFNVVWLRVFIQAWIHRSSVTPAISNSNWLWALAPSGMMLFGYLNLRFGLRRSRRAEPRILKFVQEALSAPAVAAPYAPPGNAKPPAI
jgi:hypothetical protein